MLLNDGHYHDGTSIGNELGITRAAVWKIIKKLKEYGVLIASIKGKGYFLEKSVTLLEKNKIKKQIKQKSIEIILFEKLASTNDFLKNNINSQKITVCLTEMQTHGRGRLGRIWHSPFGKNIYLSMQYTFSKDISELSGLSLVVALAVTKAIALVTAIKHTKIKWPNDIFLDDEKIAGILIDSQAETNGFCHTIIGIGINVNMDDANKRDINQPWGSLSKKLGHSVDRNALSAVLINILLDYLERFSEYGLSDFINEWNEKDYLSKKTINMVSGTKQFSGIATGITQQGFLLLTLPDNATRAFSSGDASILKK